MNLYTLRAALLLPAFMLCSLLVSQTCTVNNLNDGGDEVAVWLMSGPYADNYVFDGSGTFTQNEDGTALLTGTVIGTDSGNQLDLVVNFENGSSWSEWSALGRSYKDEPGIVGDNYLDYTYYEMSSSSTMTLNGGEDVLTLNHAPANYYYGFQVGVGANATTAVPGLGGWFTYESGEGGGQGDILLEGDCPIVDCPDLALNIGDPCDDGDETTVNDTVSADCVCVGTPSTTPENDLCADANPIACGESVDGSTTDATADASLESCGTSLTSSGGVWYSYVGTGQIVTASTCGAADYDTKIGVFTGACDALDCVTGNDDNCALQSSVTFPSEAGSTYYVYVTGFGSSTGNFTLSLTCEDVTFDCPDLSLNIGDACDDGDATTINDTVTADCLCVGESTETPGCTDETACNYNPDATTDDGSCEFGLWYIPAEVGGGPALIACSAPDGYELADQDCAQTVVDNDSFCVNTSFDGICYDAYDACLAGPCDALAATISTTSETTICADDGEDDLIDVSIDDAGAGSNSAYVITDADLTILGIAGASPINLEGAGAGTCLIWYLNFEDDLTGAEVGANAADLGGCFALSNPITITRLTGDDCPTTEVPGCTDETASNYNPDANVNDGSCLYLCDTDPADLLDVSTWTGFDDGGGLSYGNNSGMGLLDGANNAFGGNLWNVATAGVAANDMCVNMDFIVTGDASAFPKTLEFRLINDGTPNVSSFNMEVAGPGTYNLGGIVSTGVPGGAPFDPDGQTPALVAAIAHFTGTPLVGNIDVVFSNLCLSTDCGDEIFGCTDETACNYNPDATTDDGSCEYGLWYIPAEVGGGPALIACSAPDGYELADQDCAAEVVGNDSFCGATSFDGICFNAYNLCLGLGGCTDDTACNYDADAAADDGSCVYATGCDECDGAGGVIDNPEIGDACDDGDDTTINDVYTTCDVCEGESTENPGCTDPTACNYDADATTDDGSCDYSGQLWYIPAEVGGGPAVLTCGDAPDGYELADQVCAAEVVAADPFCVNTSFDGICYNAYDECLGIVDCPDLALNIGDPCDDGDETTENDAVSADCVCVGTPIGVTPENDLCADATPIACGDALAGSTTNATADESLGTCGTILTTAGGVWYSFVGTGQDVTASTCDAADYDTKIGVFTGACDALECVAGNDDGAGCTGFTSLLTWTAEEGTAYSIYVSGWNANVGNFTLSLTCVDETFDCPDLSLNIGDACDDGDANTVNDTVTADCLCVGESNETPGCTDETACNYNPDATTDDGSCDFSGQLWYIPAEVGGGPAVLTCGDAPVDYVLADQVCAAEVVAADAFCGTTSFDGICFGAYDECLGIVDCPDLALNIGDPCDDGDETTENDAVSADCVCVGTLIPTTPENDECAGAIALGAGESAISNVGATASEGYTPIDDGCNGTGGWCAGTGQIIENDVFYSFTTPGADALVTVETSFDGSGTWTDTQMAILDACGGAQVGANDDGGADTFMSKLTFACGVLAPSTTYYILLDGYAASEGTALITITYDEEACTGGGDPGSSCADAIDVSAGGLFNTGLIDGVYDPALGSAECYGAPATNGNWFSYTAVADGQVTVSSVGLSAVDTQVAAGTGDCGALTEVACNDDFTGSSPWESEISFGVIAGETYYIQWTDGWEETASEFTVTWTEWECPLIAANIGDACDDGNEATIGDAVNGFCLCVGSLDCPVDPVTLSADVTEICLEAGDTGLVQFTADGGGGSTNELFQVGTDGTIGQIFFGGGTLINFANAPANDYPFQFISYIAPVTGFTQGLNVADIEGCFELSNVLTITMLGAGCDPGIAPPLEEGVGLSLSSYPNPSNGESMTLELANLPGEGEIVSMELVDVFGRTVNLGQFTNIDNSTTRAIVFENELEDGVYYVRVNYNGIVETHRFVVNN